MKLSINALKERAEATISDELLESINGGLLDGCHADDFFPTKSDNPIGDFFEPWVPKN